VLIEGVMHRKTTTVVEQITGRKQGSFAQFAKDDSEFFDKEIKMRKNRAYQAVER
jgi:hypothetical protein